MADHDQVGRALTGPDEPHPLEVQRGPLAHPHGDGAAAQLEHHRVAAGPDDAHGAVRHERLGDLVGAGDDLVLAAVLEGGHQLVDGVDQLRLRACETHGECGEQGEGAPPHGATGP